MYCPLNEPGIPRLRPAKLTEEATFLVCYGSLNRKVRIMRPCFLNNLLALIDIN